MILTTADRPMGSRAKLDCRKMEGEGPREVDVKNRAMALCLASQLPGRRSDGPCSAQRGTSHTTNPVGHEDKVRVAVV